MIQVLLDFDNTFEPKNHFIELADGRQSNNVALKRGSVKITLRDTAGKTYDSILNNCLYHRILKTFCRLKQLQCYFSNLCILTIFCLIYQRLL